jgi:hypothetical protein
MTVMPATAAADGEMPRVRRSGTFRLPLAPDTAFALFTADGESQWVPGWSPRILGKLPQERGLVFLTGEGDEATIWTVLEHDRRNWRHRYSRVTPSLRAGTVEVSLAAEPDGCSVHVAYDLTALPGAGEAALSPYGEEAFAAMLQDWRRLIIDWFAEQQRLLNTAGR